MKIKDGTGNGNEAKVDDKKQLRVHSISESIFQDASDVDGQAYSFYSTYAATADDNVIYIKNIHTDKHLHIQNINVSSDVASVWALSEVTAGVAAGTTLLGKNLNLSSGNTAQATSFGNAAVTGITTIVPITAISSAAGATEFFNLRGGLIISANDEIVVDTSATGTVHITVLAFYEGKD